MPPSFHQQHSFLPVQSASSFAAVTGANNGVSIAYLFCHRWLAGGRWDKDTYSTSQPCYATSRQQLERSRLPIWYAHIQKQIVSVLLDRNKWETFWRHELLSGKRLRHQVMSFGQGTYRFCYYPKTHLSYKIETNIYRMSAHAICFCRREYFLVLFSAAIHGVLQYASCTSMITR